MNFGQIKSALTAYTQRPDALSVLPIIQPLAEQRIYYGEQNTPALRISAMLKDGSTFAVPADWIAMKSVSSGGDNLDFIPYNEFSEYRTLSGVPIGYSIDAGNLAIGPTAVGATVAYRYYAKFPALVADADSNWLSINAPSVYIHSLCIEWAQIARDATLLANSVQNYTSAVLALTSADMTSQMSGSTLRRAGPHGR